MLDPKGPAFLCRLTTLLQGAQSLPGGIVAAYPGCFPISWLLSPGEEDTWMCSREGKGEGNGLSASDLKEQVPFVDHAVQLGAFSWH